MASHSALFRENVAGISFAEIEFTDRVRMRHVRRCTINGKPVSREVFNARLLCARESVKLAAERKAKE